MNKCFSKDWLIPLERTDFISVLPNRRETGIQSAFSIHFSEVAMNTVRGRCLFISSWKQSAKPLLKEECTWCKGTPCFSQSGCVSKVILYIGAEKNNFCTPIKGNFVFPSTFHIPLLVTECVTNSAGWPTIQFTSETVYLDIASDPTG